MSIHSIRNYFAFYNARILKMERCAMIRFLDFLLSYYAPLKKHFLFQAPHLAPMSIYLNAEPSNYKISV